MSPPAGQGRLAVFASRGACGDDEGPVDPTGPFVPAVQPAISSKRLASRFLRTLAGSHTRPFMAM